MPPLLKRFFVQVFAALLTGFGGFLVQRGVISESESTEYIAAAAAFLAGLIWVLWQQYHDRLAFLAARILGANPSGAQIDHTMKTDRVKDLAFKATGTGDGGTTAPVTFANAEPKG